MLCGNKESKYRIKHTMQKQRYYKYYNNDKQIIESLFKKRKIRFSQPYVFNDPLEFNPSFKFKLSLRNTYLPYCFDNSRFLSTEQYYQTHIIEPIINKYGILSLTDRPDYFNMWNFYANGHKGFVIEFKSDFNRHDNMLPIKDKTRPYPIKRVNYTEDYSIIIDNYFNDDGSIKKEQLLEYLFYTKTSRWAKENEYRMVRPLVDSVDYTDYYPTKEQSFRDIKVYLFNFSLSNISAIYFGACMSPENKILFADYCKSTNIVFYQSILMTLLI